MSSQEVYISDWTNAVFREGDNHLSRVCLPMFGVINASLMSCKMVPVVSVFTPIDQNFLGLSYLHILILLGFFGHLIQTGSYIVENLNYYLTNKDHPFSYL